ncbi:hypothetical protein BG000_001729 [Podila horticola]|nr:hypothetical protein BG000_001729 [Podila horticola]
MLRNTTANYLMSLFCLVDGESASNVFPVKLSADESIGDLKNLIKTALSPQFDDVTAKDLTLWRVSIPITDDDNAIPILLNNVTSDKKKLGPVDDISDVFEVRPPKKTIHIIVQRPPPTLKRASEHELEDPQKLPRTSDWVKYDAKDGPVDLPPVLVSLLNSGQFTPAPRNEFKQ